MSIGFVGLVGSIVVSPVLFLSTGRRFAIFSEGQQDHGQLFSRRNNRPPVRYLLGANRSILEGSVDGHGFGGLLDATVQHTPGGRGGGGKGGR